jgi:2-polyprenyl-3-methyl-5-hydroxy-6-metoxy-1,4-benzoquinol methylase
MQFARKQAGREILDLGCATGMYCLALAKLGYSVKGADVNQRYVSIAKERGVDAYLIEGSLPFPDRSFDTVILFEVLEHLAEPDKLLADAKRLARKNVLITTPNSEGVESLQARGLLFEHFADLDHKNFFTEESLKVLLARQFSRVTVWKGNAISPLSLLKSTALLYVGRVLTKLHLLRPNYFMRLYAVAEP